MITKDDLWWLPSLKVGDRLEVQPYWNETSRSDKLTGPLEVMAIRRADRVQAGFIISVRPEGCEYSTCLSAAWFVGPWGSPKFKREDGWWIAKRNDHEKRTEPAA